MARRYTGNIVESVSFKGHHVAVYLEYTVDVDDANKETCDVDFKCIEGYGDIYLSMEECDQVMCLAEEQFRNERGWHDVEGQKTDGLGH